MSRTLQIVIDCHDPHSLNRFWAEVLQYDVEDHHDQIEQVIAEGFATVDDTVVIDGRRAWAIAAASRTRTGPARACCSSRSPRTRS